MHMQVYMYIQDNLIRCRYLSRFISFPVQRNPFSLSSYVTDAFPKELKERTAPNALYSRSLCAEIGHGNTPFHLHMPSADSLHLFIIFVFFPIGLTKGTYRLV